jgi:hypothetical protein
LHLDEIEELRDRSSNSPDTGKTWSARALAPKACRGSAIWPQRADGSHSKLLDRLDRVDLLAVDDWAMAPMSEPEAAAS